jgi:hypothetical protein
VVGLAPRAPGDSVRPRRPVDVVMRPLNFTVRRHAPVVEFVVVTLALTVALIATVMRSSLTPKGALTVRMTLALMPLLLLWLLQWIEYRHWNWWPSAYGSVIAPLLAWIASLGLLVLALARATGSLRAKVLLDALAWGLWCALWFGDSLLIACSMGDCP